MGSLKTRLKHLEKSLATHRHGCPGCVFAMPITEEYILPDGEIIAQEKSPLPPCTCGRMRKTSGTMITGIVIRIPVLDRDSALIRSQASQQLATASRG